MKRIIQLLAVSLATCFGFIATTPASACTNFSIKAQDGSVMVCRTLEFGPNLHSRVMTSPRGRRFASKAANGNPGKRWQAKYGYIFVDFFGTGRPIDGMNEKGLSFGDLYLPGYTQYPSVPNGKDKDALSYLYLGDWILGNFNNVDDVKKALQTIDVFAKPASFGPYKNTIFPLHVIVTDASKKSITIEFIKGKMKIHDNKSGILTNSPPYNWQINNLKNYANLSPYSPRSIKIGGIEYSGTGQGAGAVGLPGDYSPPSRFVKMSFLVQNAYPVNDAKQALNLAQHIIHNVDIPNGIVRGVKGSNSPTDTTQWTVFKDLQHRILYFTSYTNTTLQAIHLDQLDLSANAPQLKLPIVSQQIVVDVTRGKSR